MIRPNRLLAVSLLALGLAACGQQEPPAPAQPGSMSGSTGASQTPPGAAGDADGNKAPENVRDDVPTQQQLDPIPEANKPAGGGAQ